MHMRLQHLIHKPQQHKKKNELWDSSRKRRSAQIFHLKHNFRTELYTAFFSRSISTGFPQVAHIHLTEGMCATRHTCVCVSFAAILLVGIFFVFRLQFDSLKKTINLTCCGVFSWMQWDRATNKQKNIWKGETCAVCQLPNVHFFVAVAVISLVNNSFLWQLRFFSLNFFLNRSLDSVFWYAFLL